MIKQFRIIPLFGILLIFSLSGFSQNSFQDCRKLCYGSYKEDGKDSVYVFRGLKYWMEYDVKHAYKAIFSIHWYDQCRFTLTYVGSRSMDSAFNRYKPGDTISFSASNSSDTSITFNVHSSFFILYSSFYWYNGTAIWDNMLKQDTNMENLIKDTTSLVARYANRFTNAYEEQAASMTDTAELNRVNDLINILKYGSVDSIYKIASRRMIKQSPPPVINAYNLYIRSFYGRLQWYSSIDLPENPVFKKSDPKTRTFILNTGFEKVNVPVKLSIRMEADSLHRVSSFAVVADSAAQITAINSFTQPLLHLIMNEKYRDFYEGLCEKSKQKIPFDSVKKALVTIHNKGHLDEFRLYFQTFTVNDKQGGFIASYQRKTNGERTTIDFNFLYENGKFMTESISMGR
jgi:hypothetical protein